MHVPLSGITSSGVSEGHGKPPITMHKMTPEAFLNLFECSARVAGWLESQWAVILMPCLAGPSQEAVDTVTSEDATNYKKVQDAILQTVNLSPKAYCRQRTECEPLVLTST